MDTWAELGSQSDDLLDLSAGDRIVLFVVVEVIVHFNTSDGGDVDQVVPVFAFDSILFNAKIDIGELVTVASIQIA
jgi:hypothetical protein